MTGGQGKKVIVAGGGLAGLAAAAALSRHGGASIELHEARKTLGGRAGSFIDVDSGELVDHCQHVGMGCCTNLADFFRRAGAGDLLRRDRRLHFFGPEGGRSDLAASPLLPAPLHLAPSLLRQKFLTLRERLMVARGLWRLARTNLDDDETTVAEWLTAQGQSPRAIERFWSVVLVSALGETLERASLAAAKKVFVDGFLTHRRAYEIEVPRAPLGTLYEKVAASLTSAGVEIQRGSRIERVAPRGEKLAVRRHGGEEVDADAVILAVPWRRLGELLADELKAAIPKLDEIEAIPASPITSVHLWFDRAITSLPHAVLVGRLSQWMFRRDLDAADGDYVQVVISASRSLAGKAQEKVLEEVLADLKAIFPEARRAALLRWRMVTQREAVFSYRPGLDRIRPPQRTASRGLYLAGDWTLTGWPATMEGAVRGGYLAAEETLRDFGMEQKFLVGDLPRGRLARLTLWSTPSRAAS